MTVRVVTDSTAYLPDGFARRYGIRMVPLHVFVDGVARVEGTHAEQPDESELDAGELVTALRSRADVHTSRPNPAEFAEVFGGLLDEGADEVVSVHLSRELSGTWEAARIAADQFGRVRVVDSRSTAMGLGFAVLDAAERARAGAPGAEVEAAAAATAETTSTWFCVPTLEYLRRGGRIGAAAAVFGTALAVKPLLHIDDGRIAAGEKVRTQRRAAARLVELAAAAAGDRPARLAVHHLGARQQAVTLAEQLAQRLPRAHDPYITELGAVIGAHTGPGVFGVVVAPEPGESESWHHTDAG